MKYSSSVFVNGMAPGEQFWVDFSPICKDDHKYWVPGGTQFWVTRHVPPKRPYFFFAPFHRKTPIFTNFQPMTPYFLTKNWIFRKFRQIVEMLRNFWPFWPCKPLFFDAFHWETPYFCALCHWKTPFLTQFVTERPLHLKCLVALVRHFHMWVHPRVLS